MVDWRALISTLALPGATALGIWLIALLMVPGADIADMGGAGALLILMLQFGYGLSAIRLAMEGVAQTIEAHRQGLRSEWSQFPNRYDRSVVAMAVAVAVSV